MNVLYQDTNNLVNSVLLPTVTTYPAIEISLKLLFVLYAALIAPKISPSFAPLINNPVFKILYMSLIVWIFSKDPTTSVLLAVSYYVTITYLTKNSLQQVQKTGVVSHNTAQGITGEATNAKNLQQLLERQQFVIPQQDVQPVQHVQTVQTVPTITTTGDLIHPSIAIEESGSISGNPPDHMHILASVIPSTI